MAQSKVGEIMSFPSGVTLELVPCQADPARDVVIVGNLAVLVYASRDNAYNTLLDSPTLYNSGHVIQAKGGNDLWIWGAGRTLKLTFDHEQLSNVEVIK